MKRLVLVFAAVMLFGLAATGYCAQVKNYSNTIDTFKGNKVVAEFFKNAYGYAVFPTIGKAGFIVGGSYGEGQVYKGGMVTGKTSVIEGSIGFQFGGKAFSEVIFFKDKKAYDSFTSGSFEFGATAQAIIVTAGGQIKMGSTGASAGASVTPESSVQSKAKYINGMAIFVHAKGGLMYELSVNGQKFTFKPIK